MNKPAPITRDTLRTTALYTVLFTLLAHGYRFLNMSFSGDAAQISQAGEIAYQTSIGRFLQPVYWHIRGFITAPLTIGLFATAGLLGASLMVVSLLRLSNRRSIALVCGILATNETLGVSYATYLPWADVYMVAFFFAIAGVYLHARFRHGWLLSPLFYFISLGLYQSYLQTAVVLIMLLLILRLMDGERAGGIWLDGLKACAALLVALILYYIAVQYAPRLIGIEALDDYNSARNAIYFEAGEILDLLMQTCLYPFQFFTRAADSAFVPPILTLLLLLLGLPALLIPCFSLSIPAKLTVLLLLAALPFGSNFAAFLSKGFIHPLMVYAFYFLYVLIIVLWDRPALHLPARVRTLFRHACALLCAIMVLCNIFTANQLYLRRDLEFYATTSAATRILKHMDDVEGYVPGETPVCMLGYLPSSSISLVRPGFEQLSNLQGMRYTYAASYETSTPWYYQMILGYPVNFVSDQQRKEFENSAIGDDMPAFPAEGCYKMIDGILFIKIS